MIRYVGWQIPAHERNDTRDAWVSETLNENFPSNRSAGSNDEDFHSDENSGVDNGEQRQLRTYKSNIGEIPRFNAVRWQDIYACGILRMV